jgi:fructose-1,6-bisphosphatase/inositol monophosphatase family enzyme
VRADGELVDAVAATLREVAATVITPRFRRLAEGDVTQKSPGELVTIADTEAEQAVSAALLDVLPGSVVVGEEATAAQPGLLDGLQGEAVWLIDPIDGTSNFVAGSDDHAVMVALLERGETVAAWIFQPAHDQMWSAVRGQGTTVDGTQVRRGSPSRDPARLTGIVKTRYMPEGYGSRFHERGQVFGALSHGPGAAGVEYPAVVAGDVDFILYWRTLAWDHAPGSLICSEAGAWVSRLDGRPYRPWESGVGLIVAADEATRLCVMEALDPNGELVVRAGQT